MASKTIPAKKQQELQATYSNYKNTLQQLAQKIGDVEQEAEEHKLVLETLEPLSNDRKCFRMINGVLVERTVKDVVPALKTNAEGLKKVLDDLVKQYKTKQDDLEKWKLMPSPLEPGTLGLNTVTIEKEQYPGCSIVTEANLGKYVGWQDMCVEIRLRRHVENRNGVAVLRLERYCDTCSEVQIPEITISKCSILPVHDDQDPWTRRIIHWGTAEKGSSRSSNITAFPGGPCVGVLYSCSYKQWSLASRASGAQREKSSKSGLRIWRRRRFEDRPRPRAALFGWLGINYRARRLMLASSHHVSNSLHHTQFGYFLDYRMSSPSEKNFVALSSECR
ncbi:Prefoldin subunit-domain-containing protein [Xylaria digitata]|nr:Prefoldin subunit-domain-containing protein [Xylaria digitata]